MEYEEPRHKRQLETCILRDTLEAREQPQDNGQQHHEYREQDRRQDTLSNENISDFSDERATQGLTEMMPTTTFGKVQIHARNLAVTQTVWMFEMTPTKATGCMYVFRCMPMQRARVHVPGKAQRRIRPAVAA